MKCGMYRNGAGAELHVTGVALRRDGWITLGGIYTAEDRDPLFGTTTYLVTEESMRDSGYDLIEAGGAS